MFNVFGSGIVGPAHSNRNQGGQDRFIFIEDRDAIFLAVADGAGSLSKSDKGAEISVLTAVNFLRISDFDNNMSELLENAVLTASKTLKQQVDWRELGCTLTVGLITPTMYGVAVIGDALAVIKEFNGDFLTVRPPKYGEYANVTKLLTSTDFEIEIHVGETENLEFMALGSDGMDLSSISKDGTPFVGFWKNLLKWGRNKDFNMNDFLLFLEDSEKVDDDTTLVMAVNKKEY